MTLPRSRWFIGLAVAALMAAAGFATPAHAQQADACNGAPPSAYADATTIPEAHRASVDCATYQRLLGGSPDGDGQLRFHPDRVVTRAQMATLLVNAIVAGGHDQSLSDGATDRFDDIADSVHRLGINRLADAGIARGSGGAFSPDAPVTRQQMASFVVAAAGFIAPNAITDDGADRFGDVSPDNVHRRHIESGADSGLFSGVTATRFAPGTPVRRAQLATFGVTLLRRTGAEDMLEPWEGFGRTTLTIARATAGDLRVPAYDAATPASRSQGLMHRDSLRADAGMVFRFPADRRGGFWMKNTTIPLSIAFFTADGRIVAIMDMEPCEQDPCPTYDPGVPYRGALEVNQGFFAEHDVVIGDTVRLAAALPPAT